MEAVGRKWRVGVVLGVGVALVLGAVTLRRSPPVAPPPPPVAAAPPLDLDGLYAVDRLVLEADPVLDLAGTAPVGAGPRGGAPIPEPSTAALWILALATLYTLYLPAGSW
jgi:hypothetical protein